MKKLLMVLALVAVVAAPALARENVSYTGTYPTPTHVRSSDVELEWDSDGACTHYGASPNWTDYTVVSFEIPAGGPFLLNEVRYFAIGTETYTVKFLDGGGLSDPPTDWLLDGPEFTTGYAAWPPADWTTVNVAGLAQTVNSGDIVRPGVELLGTAFGIGLFDVGAVPGHSWAQYGGEWTDDTNSYGYDDGIRLGINTVGTPAVETTWGAVKNLFR